MIHRTSRRAFPCLGYSMMDPKVCSSSWCAHAMCPVLQLEMALLQEGDLKQ